MAPPKTCEHEQKPPRARAVELAERVPMGSSLVFRAEAVIAAPAERVWDMLVDLPRYAEWNPWNVHVEGDLSPGGLVWCEVVLGKRRMRVKHTVLTVRPNERLCWRDASWYAAVVYGQRCRTLLPKPEGTVLFTQELLLDEPLRALAAATFGAAMRAGLATETAAFKA
jgi:uncharacterized protein YndB with AHSA1/START domain